MNHPRVSVLLAVRNEEAYLPAALRSLMRQTLEDWELVAVDDGSSDATPMLLGQAASKDRRVRVFRRPAQGLVAALNEGLRHCRAPLVARMDGDDVCHPERLERQVNCLERHPELDLLACRVRSFPRPAISAGMRYYEDWQNVHLGHEEILRDIFVESPFAHPSVVYRRDQVLELGGYRKVEWAEDYDLWLRMSAAGLRFARLPETLLFWRDRPERLSRTSSICSREAFRRCKLHYLQQGFLKTTRRVALWGAGEEGKAWRHLLAESGLEISCWIEVDPRKIGQIIHGAPVVGIDRLPNLRDRILVTIGAKGGRQQARLWAFERGLVDGETFLCVA